MATVKTSWISEIYQKSNWRTTTNVQAFDTKWDEVLPAVTDRPADSILVSLYKMQVQTSRDLKSLLQETTIGDIEVDGPKTSRAESQRFLF